MNVLKIKNYNLSDTICAIATFPSRSALGVIKVSGKDSIPVMSKIFLPKKKKDLKEVRTFTLHYGWIVDQPKSNRIVDEVLVSVMRKPNSYTKEDVVEISSHGGAAVLNKILDTLTKQGLRLALPGEFTYRALLSGRIDLIQAQSILNIVDAKTPHALELASSQLKGDVSKRLRALKEDIKELFIRTEAYINFPEDETDITSSSIKKEIQELAKQVEDLNCASNQAKIIREGVKCVICGKTNAGKSTLFNRLLREERVIVSKVSGTTRDVIEETINIKGIPLRIYDTAGILEPKDLVTKEALKKTNEIFADADLVILVLDGARPLNKDDLFLIDKAKDKNTVLVINKSDLEQKFDLKDLKIKAKIINMSALCDKGLRKIEDAVYNNVYKGSLNRENIIFLESHQRKILEELNDKFQDMKRFIKNKETVDFINLSLKNCLDDMAKLTGEVASEEVLESIFSNFCIGK